MTYVGYVGCGSCLQFFSVASAGSLSALTGSCPSAGHCTGPACARGKSTTTLAFLNQLILNKLAE
jgi:hypothetical protein